MAKIKYKDPETGEWVEIQTKHTKQQLVDILYPAGTIYTNFKEVSPADLFGGTWSKVENKDGYFSYRRMSDNLDYSVDAYGSGSKFAINSNGYYESQNKGQGNSYAMCKVNISAVKQTTLTISYISSGESNYDYGIFSNLDVNLGANNSADSSGVFKTCKGEASTDVKTLTYNIPTGSHFITIKYIKDGSSDSGNDSLQFKLDFVETK